jgi:hypothetical protein
MENDINTFERNISRTDIFIQNLAHNWKLQF